MAEPCPTLDSHRAAQFCRVPDRKRSGTKAAEDFLFSEAHFKFVAVESVNVEIPLSLVGALHGYSWILVLAWFDIQWTEQHDLARSRYHHPSMHLRQEAQQ
jgi:hypothetical protein